MLPLNLGEVVTKWDSIISLYQSISGVLVRTALYEEIYLTAEVGPYV
jgi:hypothetical protein